MKTFGFIALGMVLGWIVCRMSYPDVMTEVRMSTDTTYVTQVISDSAVVPEFRFRENVDTLYVLQVDTLWREAKDYWGVTDSTCGEYTARFDTVVVRDADTVSRTEVEYRSVMPLHPRSFFSFRQELKERNIETVTVMHAPEGEVTERFGIGLFAGYGYGEKGFLCIGVGLTFRIL